ncbi:uncharacterized protein METZ01_LOCUS159833, partial [marine metagenome]
GKDKAGKKENTNHRTYQYFVHYVPIFSIRIFT